LGLLRGVERVQPVHVDLEALLLPLERRARTTAAVLRARCVQRGDRLVDIPLHLTVAPPFAQRAHDGLASLSIGGGFFLFQGRRLAAAVARWLFPSGRGGLAALPAVLIAPGALLGQRHVEPAELERGE